MIGIYARRAEFRRKQRQIICAAHEQLYFAISEMQQAETAAKCAPAGSRARKEAAKSAAFFSEKCAALRLTMRSAAEQAAMTLEVVSAARMIARGNYVATEGRRAEEALRRFAKMAQK